MPVYLDSPLAIQATEVFRRHTAYLDDETRELITRGEDPLRPRKCTLRHHRGINAINNLAGPAIVISASGMADAGRIKHHLRHNVWREGASIVFVGFQAQGTTGRKIVMAQKIHLFNKDVAVRTRVFNDKRLFRSRRTEPASRLAEEFPESRHAGLPGPV